MRLVFFDNAKLVARRICNRACLGALLIVAAACGRSGKPPRSLVQQNTDRPALPADQVQLVEGPDRPALQLVRRRGDPRSTVAVAVVTKGGSRDALLLTALLQKRLKKTGRILSSQTHSLGLVMGGEVATPEEAAQFVEDVAQALRTEVTSDEVRVMTEGYLLRAAQKRSVAPSPYGSCMAELGNEGKAALLDELKDSERAARAERMELLRSTLVSGQVGLSAVGDEETLEAVARAVDRPWLPPGRIEDLWSVDEQVAVVPSAGGRELRLAVRLDQSDAALSAARSLADPHHPFVARLAALSVRFIHPATHVTLRPSGACLGLSVSFDSKVDRPSASKLASAATLLLEEMRATARESAASEERTRALLAPAGAVEAAALAAWTAVRSETTVGAWQDLVEYRTPPGEDLSSSELAAALRSTRAAWQERTIPVSTRDEAGQAELWLLLASRCGPNAEPPQWAGLRAMTVASLATQFDGRRGVNLLPWISHGGVGLIAHAPAEPGESADAHARRVARALAAAFSGAPLDGRTVAEARAAQLESVGSDPGRDLVLEALAGTQPSELVVAGWERSVATFSLTDVQRTREDFVREPLSLAVLNNGPKGKDEAARAALEQWLAPSRDHLEECQEPVFEVPPVKQWTLQNIEDGVASSAFVAIPTAGPPELGHATAYLLNQGPLQRALELPELAASAEASFWGSRKRGALVVQIGAEESRLEEAVAQVRGLLERWAEEGISPAQVTQARDRFEHLLAQSRRTPATRLIRLWLDSEAVPIDSANLRIFHRQLGAEGHRVVLVKNRK